MYSSPPFLLVQSDRPLSLPRGILLVKRKMCCILCIFTFMLSYWSPKLGVLLKASITPGKNIFSIKKDTLNIKKFKNYPQKIFTCFKIQKYNTISEVQIRYKINIFKLNNLNHLLKILMDSFSAADFNDIWIAVLKKNNHKAQQKVRK